MQTMQAGGTVADPTAAYLFRSPVDLSSAKERTDSSSRFDVKAKCGFFDHPTNA